MATPGSRELEPLAGSYLGENVRRLIGMHLLSTERLADGIGMSRQALFNIGADRSKPTWETMRKLAVAFGISAEDLDSDPQTCLRAAVEGMNEAPAARWHKRYMPKDG